MFGDHALLAEIRDESAEHVRRRPEGSDPRRGNDAANQRSERLDEWCIWQAALT
jgi:hypothetical protein